MDRLKAIFIGASCAVFVGFAYYNFKKLFGSGGGGDGKPTDLKVKIVSKQE